MQIPANRLWNVILHLGFEVVQVFLCIIWITVDGRENCSNWKALLSSIPENKGKAALAGTPECCHQGAEGWHGRRSWAGGHLKQLVSLTEQRLICCKWCECSNCFWKARGRITGETSEVVTDRLVAFQWQTKGHWSIWGERVSPPQRKCNVLRLLLIMKMKNCILRSWQRCWQTVAASSKLTFAFVPCFDLLISYHS